MNQRVLGVALFVGFCSLCGCGGEPPPAATTGTAAGASATSPGAGAAAPESVAAVALGAASVPIKLGFIVPVRPEPGRKSVVTLTVVGAEDMDRVEISVRSTSLMVAPETATFVLTPLRAGQTAQHALEITPQAAGLADLELHVRAQSAAGERNADFAVPILAETPAAPAG